MVEVVFCRRKEAYTIVMVPSSEPTVLAIEPDPIRASVLKTLVCGQHRVYMLVANSVAAVRTATAERVPDLVLIGTSLVPREEIEIKNHLRTLQASAPFEMVRIPATAIAPQVTARPGLLGLLKKQPSGEAGDQAVPASLSTLVAGAIERMRSIKARGVLDSSRRAAPAIASPPAARPVKVIGFPSRSPEEAVAPHSGRTDVARAAALREAIAARPVQPAPQKDPQPGSSRPIVPKPPEATNEDEWGLFDPERCGYKALSDALDAIPSDPQRRVEQSPADMLLEYGSKPAASAPKRPLAAPCPA